MNINDFKVKKETLSYRNNGNKIVSDTYTLTKDNGHSLSYFLGNIYTSNINDKNLWNQFIIYNNFSVIRVSNKTYNKPIIWDSIDFKNDFINFLFRCNDKETVINGMEILAITSISNNEIFQIITNNNLTTKYNKMMDEYRNTGYNDTTKNILFICRESNSVIKNIIFELDKKIRQNNFHKEENKIYERKILKDFKSTLKKQ